MQTLHYTYRFGFRINLIKIGKLCLQSSSHKLEFGIGNEYYRLEPGLYRVSSDHIQGMHPWLLKSISEMFQVDRLSSEINLWDTGSISCVDTSKTILGFENQQYGIYGQPQFCTPARLVTQTCVRDIKERKRSTYDLHSD